MPMMEWDDSLSKSDQLGEVKEVMEEAVSRIEEILHGTGMTWERARSYWLAHIKCALDNNHGYLGGDMFTLQSAIDELKEGGESLESDPEDDTP